MPMPIIEMGRTKHVLNYGLLTLLLGLGLSACEVRKVSTTTAASTTENNADETSNPPPPATHPNLVFDNKITKIETPSSLVAGQEVTVKIFYSSNTDNEIKVDLKRISLNQTLVAISSLKVTRGENNLLNVKMTVPSSSVANTNDMGFLVYIFPQTKNWLERYHHLWSASLSLSAQVASTTTPTPPSVPNPVETPTNNEPNPVPPLAQAGCGCTAANAATGCFTNSFVKAGSDFSWKFSCNGKACRCGQFVNGEAWVAAIDSSGNSAPHVVFSEILPAGLQHGVMANAASFTKQGLLNMYTNSYDPALNIMTKLPYSAAANTSLLKIKSKTSGCGTSAISKGCAANFDVLTVLAAVPPNSGTTIFRPPFNGSNKPLYSIDKVRFNRLPRMPIVSGNRSASGFESIVSSIAKRWTIPQYEIARSTEHFGGEFYRATSPHEVLPDYAAGQASAYLSDLINVFGTESNELKSPAVYALMQKGIDIYGAFKIGARFGTGAGQHIGKKPSLVFFAAMYDDTSVLNEVRAIATNKEFENSGVFQEDSQVRATPDGKYAVWGGTSVDAHRYWNYYKDGYVKDVFRVGSGDANGSFGDPYNYIDGPGGGISGKSYMWVAGGPLIGFAFVQHLMPYLKYTNNDWEVLQFADRFFRGRGFSDIKGGFFAIPDLCAAFDEREHTEGTSCRADRGYLLSGITNLTQGDVMAKTGCKYYMITWGPDPNKRGDCIRHNGNPKTDGRWSHRHGAQKEASTLKRGINYMPAFVTANWDTLRDCADPAHASYPCQGLGPVKN